VKYQGEDVTSRSWIETLKAFWYCRMVLQNSITEYRVYTRRIVDLHMVSLLDSLDFKSGLRSLELTVLRLSFMCGLNV